MIMANDRTTMSNKNKYHLCANNISQSVQCISIKMCEFIIVISNIKDYLHHLSFQILKTQFLLKLNSTISTV